MTKEKDYSAIAREAIESQEIESASKFHKVFKILFLAFLIPGLLFTVAIFVDSLKLFYVIYPVCTVVYFVLWKKYKVSPYSIMKYGLIFYIIHTICELFVGLIPITIDPDPGSSFSGSGRGMFGEVVLAAIPILYIAVRGVLIYVLIRYTLRIRDIIEKEKFDVLLEKLKS